MTVFQEKVKMIFCLNRLNKNKNIGFLFIILALIILSGVYSTLKANEISNTANITVNNKPVRQIPNDMSYIGINWMNDGRINRYIFSNPNNLSELGRVLNDLKIDNIRYPNGNAVLTAFWDVPDERIVNALNKLPPEDIRPIFNKMYKATDRLSFSDFMKFCRKHNLKSTIQVNDHSIFDKSKDEIVMLKTFNRGAQNLPKNNRAVWSTGKVNWENVNIAAKYAAAQVEWVKDNNYSDLVKYWEIGNEEFGRHGLSAAYSGEEYAKVAAIFVKEMKKADPSIKIILTNSYNFPLTKASQRYKWNDRNNIWSDDVMKTPELQAEKGNLAGVVAHIQPVERVQNKQKSFDINDEFLKALNEEFKGRLEFHNNALKKFGYNTPIFVNEFNESAGEGRFTSHNWIGAILSSKLIMDCVAIPYCQHMDYHILFQHLSFDTAQYNNYGSGIVHFAKDFQKPFFLQPTAYVLKFFNENLKGTVLSSSADNKFTSSLSVQDGNMLKVILLNIKEDKTINLDLKDFKNLRYRENYSLGAGIPENFTIIDIGDSYNNPSEVRQINSLKDYIKVNRISENKYSLTLPKNTLSVFVFDMEDR